MNIDAMPIIGKTWVRYLFVVVWMSIIFLFSAQSSLPTPPDEWLNLLLKKGAHFIVFGALASLIWHALAWRKHGWTIALGITFLYACSDEFHQWFVPNRFASPIDVLIDMAGAISALLLLVWLSNRSWFRFVRERN